jgi:putative chitinase
MTTKSTSEPVKTLQALVGVKNDGVIGRNTLRAFASYFNMSNESCAHFFGQSHHETGGFRMWEENLNYSVEVLIKSFGRHRISIEDANKFGRKAGQPANQQALANILYGGEWGRRNLGNTQPTDGFDFKGRGAKHLTGRANYQRFANAINDPSIMTNPSQVADKYAFQSALFFYDNKNLWDIANRGVDDDVITLMTRRVNGGTFGLGERILWTKRYYNLLKQ